MSLLGYFSPSEVDLIRLIAENDCPGVDVDSYLVGRLRDSLRDDASDSEYMSQLGLDRDDYAEFFGGSSGGVGDLPD